MRKPIAPFVLFVSFVVALVTGVQVYVQRAPVGYDNTPFLPNSPWRVHDGKRPQPEIVTPPPATEPMRAPSDAVVLFDGTDLSKWLGADGKPARWTVADGAMTVRAGAGDIHTTELFGDVQLH